MKHIIGNSVSVLLFSFIPLGLLGPFFSTWLVELIVISIPAILTFILGCMKEYSLNEIKARYVILPILSILLLLTILAIPATNETYKYPPEIKVKNIIFGWSAVYKRGYDGRFYIGSLGSGIEIKRIRLEERANDICIGLFRPIIATSTFYPTYVNFRNRTILKNYTLVRFYDLRTGNLISIRRKLFPIQGRLIVLW